MAKIKEVGLRHKQNTDRLRRIWRGKNKAKFAHVRDHYLASFPARMAATVRTFGKKRTDASLEDIYRFAAGVDVSKRLDERVQIDVTPKTKGGYRRITKPGIRRTAQSFILRDLLTVMVLDNEHDYARRGAGGEKKMIRDVCDRIEEGYRHWQTADVVECFASLKPAHFKWLPIPEELIRNMVFLPKCARIRITGKIGVMLKLIPELASGTTEGKAPLSFMKAIPVAIEKVRRELPQGSVLSPMVARAFVGRELRAALGTHKVARLSFVDNLILGARTQLELEEALDALRSRLNGHTAGPLALHVDPPTSTKQGRVHAFGYVLQPGRGYGDNDVHVCPGFKRFDRFHKKLYARWVSDGRPGGFEGLEDYILDRLRRWIPSQQAWTVVPMHSLNLALTGAFQYVCDREMEEA